MSVSSASFVQAKVIADKLPPDTSWGITITHDTDPLTPAAFNIYVYDSTAAAKVRLALGLTLPERPEFGIEEYSNYLPYVSVSILQGDSDD